MTRTILALIVSVVALSVGACGDSGSAGACGTPETCEGGYPVGPYATDENALNKVLPDITFTTAEGDPLTLGDLRSQEGKRLLVISTTAGWCTACVEEQPKLEAFYQEYKDCGLEVLVAIFEDVQYNPATAYDAEIWQIQNELSFQVVADVPNALATFYNTASAPLNMIVDLCTMEVLYTTIGFDQSAMTAIIESELYQ